MGRQDMMGQPGHDTGLPADKSYLECGLPDFLRESIAQMQAAWDRLDRGEKDLRWDCDYCNLQADINNAEVNQVISSEQAWYLREKVSADGKGVTAWASLTLQICKNGTRHTPAQTARSFPSSMTGSNIC